MTWEEFCKALLLERYGKPVPEYRNVERDTPIALGLRLVRDEDDDERMSA